MSSLSVKMFLLASLPLFLSTAADQKGSNVDTIQVTIEEKGDIYLAGIAGYGSPESMKIGDMWSRFNELSKAIPNQVADDGQYGLMIYPPTFPNPWEFTYFAAARVKSLSDVPVQMLGKHLPKGKYAKFSVPGGTEKIKDTYQYAYQTWLPKSEYEPAYPFDFEFYKAADGKPACSSPIFVYIPVKQKKK